MTAEGRPLLCVVGPTAAGKSALAVALARAFGGEILNADSRQVYRGLDIGTAKPDAAERQGVAHHLFDLIDPEETYSAARFRADALAVAAEVSGRSRLPILVGGTGLYLRALSAGLFEGPARDEVIHRRLEAVARRGGLSRLHRWLGRVDPGWAAKVGPGDRQRILRGLDVYLQSGRPISWHIHRTTPSPLPFTVLKLGLDRPRAELYARIDVRVETMLARGWLDEVRRLLERPGFATANSAKAVGYREVVACIEGRMGSSEAVARIQRDTRHLAKRQLTWFRHEPEVHWINAASEPAAYEEARGLVEGWLWGTRQALAVG